MAVATIIFLAVAVIGSLAVLVMSQLADVAGSLTTYQTNLQQKVKDLQVLTEGEGPLSRFTSMIVSLTVDFTAHEGAATASPRFG